ncbi:H-2 class II histocompatibility antigen, A-Q alpha chain-like [Betta splendens]|uniref:H-2 class II histocompatibility antigen, A-Q alpha chain-like n=1 Tax=Betta splendens TaxID=158456 RepID=A0A6P7NAI3_BETSP|nr:H-2 class II histocompatibility antigen, A-Q alpha chain-like [Betta splendens]
MNDTMYFNIILIILGAFPTCAQRSHEFCLAYGCFDSSDTQLSVTLDGEEIFFADFKKGDLVWDSRIPTSIHMSEAYGYAKYYRTLCNHDLIYFKKDKSEVVTIKEAPEVTIYPKEEVIMEEENTLICFVKHYFPPSIKIKWTKNDVEVTSEDPFIKSLTNIDGTFYVISTLGFIPNEGDIYTCTVDCEMMDEPQTKFWEVDGSMYTAKTPDGPTIYFGFATFFGLVGVAAGTFFYVKAQQSDS